MKPERNTSQINGIISKRGFTEKEAAIYIGMSVSFLRQSRSNGDRVNRTPGPRYVRIGRAVRYLKDDLDSWLQELYCSPMGMKIFDL